MEQKNDIEKRKKTLSIAIIAVSALLLLSYFMPYISAYGESMSGFELIENGIDYVKLASEYGISTSYGMKMCAFAIFALLDAFALYYGIMYFRKKEYKVKLLRSNMIGFIIVPILAYYFMDEIIEDMSYAGIGFWLQILGGIGLAVLFGMYTSACKVKTETPPTEE